MNEKIKKHLESIGDYFEKHRPEIICSTGVCSAVLAGYLVALKQGDESNHENDVIKVATKNIEHKPRIKNEERKYANWMCYEKENLIYESYNEFKRSEDFG